VAVKIGGNSTAGVWSLLFSTHTTGASFSIRIFNNTNGSCLIADNSSGTGSLSVPANTSFEIEDFTGAIYSYIGTGLALTYVAWNEVDG
jgi:hypothetical protein